MPSPAVSPSQPLTQLQTELYKMEYEQCATSYENTYRAVWTIFSLFSALAGAILIFGGQYLHANFLAVVAISLILFWAFGIYFPLNRYGQLRSK